MPRLAGLAPALVMIAGCGSSEPLRLELPIRPDDRAAILLVEIDGAGGAPSFVAGGASDLSPPGEPDASLLPPLPRLDSGQILRAALLSYAVPLADLGLAPGALDFTTGASGEILPAAARVNAVEVRTDSDASLPWPEVGARPAWVDALRVERAGCTELIPDDALSLDVASEVVFIQHTATRVVVGLGDGFVLNFGTDVATVLTDESDDGDTFLTAVAAADGAYWISTRDGRVLRATLGTYGTEAETLVTQVPSRGELAWMDGEFVRGRPPEIFALATGRSVEHYDGSQWTRLANDAPVDLGGVVRLGPGEALIALGRPELLHVRGGTVAIERPSPTGSAITALARVPGFAVIAGTSDGRALRYESGEWSLLDTASVRGRIASIVPFGGGFIAGTTRGELVELVRGRGFCEPISATTSTLSRGTTFLGVLYAGGTVPIGASMNALVILRPR